MYLINLNVLIICLIVLTCVGKFADIIAKQNSNQQISTIKLNQGDIFSLCSTTTWLEFKINQNAHMENSKKWAWIGSITLKSRIPLKLEKLNLHWFGKKISNLQASLYQKKETDPELIPIEKNLVCDGNWNSQTQELTFNMNQKIISINNYYLLLSFRCIDETAIKSGYFVLPDKKNLHLTKL